jgi:DNA polymerase elongation subunit (family B)
MQINFIPFDYDYFDWQGRNYITIIGRDDKGKRVCIVDSFEPYFWAVLKQGISEKKADELRKKIEKIKVENPGRTTKVEKTELCRKKFLGNDVQAIKVFITNYKDAHAVADQMGFQEIEARREYDISLVTRYIIDKNITPLSWHKVSGSLLDQDEFGGIEKGLDIDMCLKAEKIEKAEDRKFSPKIMAYDIETDAVGVGKGEILMISLAGEKFKKVLTWKKSPAKPDYVECCKDEADMLEKFVEHIKKESPDMLVGYFSDGFDLPFLRARAEHNNIKLALGLDNSQPTFARGRIPSGRIFGIVHVDLFRFIETVYSQYLQSETLGLNEVASELLGEGKEDFEYRPATKVKEHEWDEYFKYNLQDSVLTYRLAEKFWPDMLELSRIIQEPLFEITRDGMSQLLENYILHRLNQYNEIAEKRPLHDEIEERRQRKRVEGAFVLEPKAGLYENLAFFDFTSMHTSIIVSFNISKATLLQKKEQKAYESPEVDWEGKKTKFYFSKEPGFLPAMCKELIEKRKKYKQEYKTTPNPITKARSNAFKVLSAAVHGYIGFFGARYYSLESSASILAFVRRFNKEAIEKVNEAGYKVIYGDTDSVAFTLESKTEKQVMEFLKKLNSELPGIMELELEDFYKRGLWVTTRTGEFGAKKKYALITESGKLKIRGFETVRRDWCTLARELQNQVLHKILTEGNEKSALEYTKKIIKELKERKVDRKQILIRTQLKKPISEYKSITPHVIAAKKMEEYGLPVDVGMLLEYFIAETHETKKLVREKVKLPDEKGEYNIEYYLEHQIIPAVENILEVFGISKDELLGKGQKKLMEF